jgi:hypothetical protein
MSERDATLATFALAVYLAYGFTDKHFWKIVGAGAFLNLSDNTFSPFWTLLTLGGYRATMPNRPTQPPTQPPTTAPTTGATTFAPTTEAPTFAPTTAPKYRRIELLYAGLAAATGLTVGVVARFMEYRNIETVRQLNNSINDLYQGAREGIDDVDELIRRADELDKSRGKMEDPDPFKKNKPDLFTKKPKNQILTAGDASIAALSIALGSMGGKQRLQVSPAVVAAAAAGISVVERVRARYAEETEAEEYEQTELLDERINEIIQTLIQTQQPTPFQ